jgi:hypothetical protein
MPERLWAWKKAPSCTLTSGLSTYHTNAQGPTPERDSESLGKGAGVVVPPAQGLGH